MLLVLLSSLIAPIVIFLPVITSIAKSFSDSFFYRDHLLYSTFKLFVGQWVLFARVLKLPFGSYPHGEIINDLSLGDIMNLGAMFSKASIVFPGALIFLLSTSSKLYLGGQVSEDTYEVTAKSLLQIIPTRNLLEAQLIEPLESYCFKRHRKEHGLDIIVTSG
jgi:hypothetical protein